MLRYSFKYGRDETKPYTLTIAVEELSTVLDFDYQSFYANGGPTAPPAVVAGIKAGQIASYIALALNYGLQEVNARWYNCTVNREEIVNNALVSTPLGVVTFPEFLIGSQDPYRGVNAAVAGFKGRVAGSNANRLYAIGLLGTQLTSVNNGHNTQQDVGRLHQVYEVADFVDRLGAKAVTRSQAVRPQITNVSIVKNYLYFGVRRA